MHCYKPLAIFSLTLENMLSISCADDSLRVAALVDLGALVDICEANGNLFIFMAFLETCGDIKKYA